MFQFLAMYFIYSHSLVDFRRMSCTLYNVFIIRVHIVNSREFFSIQCIPHQVPVVYSPQCNTGDTGERMNKSNLIEPRLNSIPFHSIQIIVTASPHVRAPLAQLNRVLINQYLCRILQLFVHAQEPKALIVRK